MKVEIDVNIEQIAKGMNFDNLCDFLSNFTENQIMDAVEKEDNNRGDWVFLERMVTYVTNISQDLHLEIDDAYIGNHISKDTYEILKEIYLQYLNKQDKQ